MRARFLVGCGALAWALLATAFAFTGVASAAGVGAGVVIEGRALAVGGADVPSHRSRTALVRYGT